MRKFEDHFSRRARTYSRHRPAYPAELYARLAALAPHRRLAWDCGTGNGQAALGLAEHFDRVVATDASAEQIALALPHRQIEYAVAHAESSSLGTGTVALTTVAVAVHWFALDQFYAEVRRVSSPGALIAVWCYSLPSSVPEVNSVVRHYLREVLAGYWPERFDYVREKYRTLPFPFEEIALPKLTMQTAWDLPELIGFLESWSGTAAFERREGRNPIELIRPALRKAWGPELRPRTLRWQLYVRAGRI